MHGMPLTVCFIIISSISNAISFDIRTFCCVWAVFFFFLIIWWHAKIFKYDQMMGTKTVRTHSQVFHCVWHARNFTLLGPIRWWALEWELFLCFSLTSVAACLLSLWLVQFPFGALCSSNICFLSGIYGHKQPIRVYYDTFHFAFANKSITFWEPSGRILCACAWMTAVCSEEWVWWQATQ